MIRKAGTGFPTRSCSLQREADHARFSLCESDNRASKFIAEFASVDPGYACRSGNRAFDTHGLTRILLRCSISENPKGENQNASTLWDWSPSTKAHCEGWCR